jgi:3-oxoacyl-[acyl-carrier protein] reductase
MDLGLTGRNCVILGASRGIGRSIALGLASEGANVALCARQDGPLQQTLQEVEALGVSAYGVTCDVASEPALSAFLDAAREALGSVDVLVHNASALAVGSDAASWDASLAVDLMPAVRACSQVLPWMRESGGGSVLLVSSISGLEIFPTPDFAYTSTKAALIAYAKKLADQEAPHGIRVNALAPGSIEFEGGIWAMVKAHNPEMYGMALGSIPSGRMGTPEEVADAAVYLLSPRASWVTGVCLAVDGGQHRGIR